MSYPIDRRSFFHRSLVASAAFSSLHSAGLVLADDKGPAIKPVADKELPLFRDGDPDTLFLTWLRDPATTITAVWVAADLSDADAGVRYAALDGDSWSTVEPVRRPYPLGGLFVYEAEMTGLAPGSQYRLRIGKRKTTNRFQTMPAKATDTFQFVSGGDSGSGRDSRESNLLAARQEPMFVLMGGDIAYDDGVSTKANLRFLKNYRSDMIDSGGRLIPLVPAIGNHETARVGDRRAAPFFQALYGGLFAERPYATLDFGDYLSLVLLDSGHMAPIGGEQTSWLDQQLAARRERPHLVAAQHVPSYPSFRSLEKTGQLSRENWVPLFEKYNIDLVLEHHDHTFKRTHPLKGGLRDKHGIVYLGDGSWGKLRALTDAENRPYLAKTASDHHVTLHRIEGGKRYHMALSGSGRVVDICTTEKRPLHTMGRGA